MRSVLSEFGTNDVINSTSVPQCLIITGTISHRSRGWLRLAVIRGVFPVGADKAQLFVKSESGCNQ